VYMFFSRSSTVMVSGLGRASEPAEPFLARRRGGGESGGRVVEDESSPSSSLVPSSLATVESSLGDSSRIVGSGSRPSSCRESIFCLMRDCEKGVALGGWGERKSWTVDLMAVVISALDV
jgi:hypothetical protein